MMTSELLEEPLETPRGQAVGRLLAKLTAALSAAAPPMKRGDTYRLVAPIVMEAFLEGEAQR